MPSNRLINANIINMNKSYTEISIERILQQGISDFIGFNNDILILNTLGEMQLFSHPSRLRATTVLVCLQGEIDCSINLRRFRITRNHLLVNFAGDIIQIHSTTQIAGYAIVLSEDYLQQLQLDFRLRAQSYIGLRRNGPIAVPFEELAALKPYYVLFKKNMEEGNADVVKSLTMALSHTILSMVRQYQPLVHAGGDKDVSRAQQIFDRFMSLLQAHHDKVRTLQFYADKMCLTPKYVSGMIKSYSGKAALEWINDYVVLEARMMLRYTQMSVQEISYSLNFPTQSAFGKYFKQQVGVSPRHYRERE